MNTLFTNARLLLPDGSSRCGCLGVSDDKIAFVGDAPADFSAQRVIDCHTNILMPAFHNLHTHLPMTLFRAAADDMPLDSWLQDRIWPLEDSCIDAESAYWFTQLSCAELLRGGVASVNDMYFCSESIVRALIDADMRALVSRAVISAGDHGASRLEEASALFEYRGANGGLIDVGVSLQGEYCSDMEMLTACADLARSNDAIIHIHVSETRKEHSQCKQRHAGMTPVRYLDSFGLIEKSILAHCVWIEDDDADLILKRGATVAHCPNSNLKLGSGVAPIVRLNGLGVNVALGTDSAASNNSLDMFCEMRCCATVQKGILMDASVMGAKTALEFATRNGAAGLGIASGELRPGAKADIIMLDCQNPAMQPVNDPVSLAVYSGNSRDVLMTMVDGRILYENREYYSLDYERVIAECSRIRDRLNI